MAKAKAKRRYTTDVLADEVRQFFPLAAFHVAEDGRYCVQDGDGAWLGEGGSRYEAWRAAAAWTRELAQLDSSRPSAMEMCRKAVRGKVPGARLGARKRGSDGWAVVAQDGRVLGSGVSESDAWVAAARGLIDVSDWALPAAKAVEGEA